MVYFHILKLGVNLLVLVYEKELKSSKNKETKSLDMIAEISETQLYDISKLFGQGDLNERDNDISINASSTIY